MSGVGHDFHDGLQATDENRLSAPGRRFRQARALPFERRAQRRRFRIGDKAGEKLGRPDDAASASLPALGCHLLHGHAFIRDRNDSFALIPIVEKTKLAFQLRRLLAQSYPTSGGEWSAPMLTPFESPDRETS